MKFLQLLFPRYFEEKEAEYLIDQDSLDTFSSYANSSFSTEEDECFCCFYICLNK